MNTPHSINNIDPKWSASAPQIPGHAPEINGKRAAAANIVSLAILNGDMTTLRELGLDRYASVGEQSLRPPAPFSGDVFGNAIEKAENFDFAKILMALVETARMLSDAHREMRHAERDFAESEAKDAAKKLRDAGKFQMVFGVAMGLGGMIMAAASLKSASKQLSTFRQAQKPVIRAEKKLASFKADMKLHSSQATLSQARGEATAAKARVTELKKQANSSQVELSEARDKAAAAEARVAKLEKQVKIDATEAKAANADYEGNLAGQIAEARQEATRAQRSGAPRDEIDLRESRVEALEKEQMAVKAEASVYENPGSAPDAADRLKEKTTLLDRIKNELAEAKEQAQLAMQGDVEPGKWQAKGQMAQGLFQIVGNVFGQQTAAEMQADQAELTAGSQKATSRENEEAEFQKSANQLLESAMNTMKEYFQALNRTESSVIHNM